MSDEGAADRTLALIGPEAYRRLRESRVAVVGLGGVGGYAVEMLARTGIGHLTLIDSDSVAPSNLNRQIIATRATVGEFKSELFRKRIAEIDPEIKVDARREYLTAENATSLVEEGYDMIVDAIDTVAPKTSLIAECMRRRQPIVSSMGAGGRTDPSKVGLTDLWQTREDGLARAVRQRLKKLGLRGKLKVAASSEPPRKNALIAEEGRLNKVSSFGTTAIVPSLFGIYLASYAIEQLAKPRQEHVTTDKYK